MSLGVQRAHRKGGLVGVPIAGDDPKTIALAEEHTLEEIRKIAAGLR